MENQNQPIPAVINSSWHEYLQPLFNNQKMKIIKEEILANCVFYPSVPQIFRVFNAPLDKIKIVIIGQDPYSKGEANGLSFAVNESQSLPASLKVIANEIKKEGLKTGFYDSDIAHWRTLESWWKDGVFLLNSALTVEKNKPASHLQYWNWFTREVVKIISLVNPCIWLLWGSKAQEFQAYISNGITHNNDAINDEAKFNRQHNYILKAPHPAAELYQKDAKNKFTGCNHFLLSNIILEKQGLTPINW